jgi:peptidoglycan hydrolase-like protein with peptidoglycan-binding domain
LVVNSSGRAPIVVDGEFGPATDKRVRQYQKANGLTVDGIVGPKTAAAMGLA